jgi:AraC family transcriptional regulator, regulatory protein of adaptative response / methylated-DNA-[protein]-cysteine methyltransferase
VKLAELASHAGVSVFHLQRTFKRVMGISPRQYLAARRFGNFKALVRKGDSVTTALYESGFNSSSRLYEYASEELGMTPATYSRGGRGVNINYTTVASSMGRLLVAMTERGVCAVRMGDTDAELENDLREEFPHAEIKRDDSALREQVQKILSHLDNNEPRLDLPLDIRATAFQRQVWDKLRAIPYGQTVSYGDVAKALGKPGAVRAVGRACATTRGVSDSLSSRCARRSNPRWISLGTRTEEEAVAEGARKVKEHKENCAISCVLFCAFLWLYSTVTDFARLRGWSTSQPRRTAM